MIDQGNCNRDFVPSVGLKLKSVCQDKGEHRPGSLVY